MLTGLPLIGRQRAAVAWFLDFLRTDRDGEGTALTDGRTLEVHTFAEAQRIEPLRFRNFPEDSWRYSSSASPTD